MAILKLSSVSSIERFCVAKHTPG